MIIVDYREKPHEKKELAGLIRKLGVHAETGNLPYGDFAFDGFDSLGIVSVGIERKRLHDILGCIDDNRLATHQRLGMKQLYQERWLLVEGLWRSHDSSDLLMEGNAKGQWWACKPAGRAVLYSKLRRYLFSVARVGTFQDILYTRDITASAQDIVHLFHYYMKRDHTSHIGKQKLNIPALGQRPSLCRRWAEEIDGIGPKKADAAAALFKTPDRLANSEPLEWLSIPGVGMATAESVVAQIMGSKR